jgi:hypothetical protein
VSHRGSASPTARMPRSGRGCTSQRSTSREPASWQPVAPSHRNRAPPRRRSPPPAAASPGRGCAPSPRWSWRYHDEPEQSRRPVHRRPADGWPRQLLGRRPGRSPAAAQAVHAGLPSGAASGTFMVSTLSALSCRVRGSRGRPACRTVPCCGCAHASRAIAGGHSTRDRSIRESRRGGQPEDRRQASACRPAFPRIPAPAHHRTATGRADRLRVTEHGFPKREPPALPAPPAQPSPSPR